MLNKHKQAILDEAARSVRRTFIGSVAGSLGMLAVIGAAGAYGMSDKVSVQTVSAAMAKLSIKLPMLAEQPTKIHLPVETSAASAAPEPKIVVADAAIRIVPPAPAVASDATPETVLTLPPAELRHTATVMPATAEAMARAVPETDTRMVPETDTRAVSETDTRAVPETDTVPAALSAPLIFEAPKLSDIKPLAPLPQTETVAEPEQPLPAQANIAWPAPDEPAPAAAPVQVELPKLALLPMPPSKPALSPAQRLELSGKAYDKALRCLAQAIYFEARNEPARGQMAVAQVVLNRVFSPYYPKDVCSVVYQNAGHYLGCQFTFACDGKPETITERGPWTRANRIAKEALDAKIWLAEVNKATHYHAAYVRPNWIREMKVMVRYGLHTFYRPRNWGDGSAEASWASASNTVKPESAAKRAATTAAHKKVPLRIVYARHTRT